MNVVGILKSEWRDLVCTWIRGSTVEEELEDTVEAVRLEAMEEHSEGDGVDDGNRIGSGDTDGETGDGGTH